MTLALHEYSEMIVAADGWLKAQGKPQHAHGHYLPRAEGREAKLEAMTASSGTDRSH